MDSRRAVDIVVSSAMMPAVAFSIVASAIANQGKPLFVQERVGFHGKRFHILKLRTMNENTFLPPAKRITPFGKFTRFICIDEMPQFINVLRGDMSLFGPRPLPLEEENKARKKIDSEKWNHRYDVVPGMAAPTMFYQKVKGIGDIDARTRLAVDLKYIAKRNAGSGLKEDLGILWDGVHAMLLLRGDTHSASRPSTHDSILRDTDKLTIFSKTKRHQISLR